jgi:8-oxo-dGTP diphosphatase
MHRIFTLASLPPLEHILFWGGLLLCSLAADYPARVMGSRIWSNRDGEARKLAGPETPKLTVDVVIPAERGVVLIRRGSEPFEGQWALPGGFVEVGETVEEAAVREVAEETGLAVELARLVGVYSEPDRDPRGHNVSVAFLARVLSGELAAATDAAEVSVLDPGSVDLAFDHRRIVDDALSLS